jgi:hypothetical protein
MPPTITLLNFLWMLAFVTELAVATSSSSSYWTTVKITGTWTGAASDASGSLLMATSSLGGHVYQSVDYGSSFQAVSSIPTTDENWFGITMSQNGSIAACISNTGGGLGNMYITRNSNSNQWSEVASAPNSVFWASIDMSATGQYIIAAANVDGVVYLSSDFGSSFSAIPSAKLPDNYYNWATVSRSGQYMYAVVGGTVDVGPIYYSNDFGVSWDTTTAPELMWYAITCDFSGQYLVAVTFGDGIHFSTDFGGTWSNSSGVPSADWHGVVSSNDGHYVVAVIYGSDCSETIFVSSNFGQMFVAVVPPATDTCWWTVAVNANASIIIVGANEGYLYVSSGLPPPIPNPTSVPTSYPTSSPTRYPTSMPTGYPTLMSGFEVRQFVNSSLSSNGLSTASSTFTNIGDSAVYLTVSFADTDFGTDSWVTVYVEDASGAMVQLCPECIVPSACSDGYTVCSGCVNLLVTSYVTSSNGGTLTLYAESSSDWSAGCPVGEFSNYEMLTVLSGGHGVPTYQPSAASYGVPNIIFTLETSVPWIVTVAAGTAFSLFAGYIHIIRHRAPGSLQVISTVSVVYSLTIFGCSFASQLLFVILCFSSSSYFGYGIAWILVRSCSIICGGLCVAWCLRFGSDDNLMNWDCVAAERKVYSLLIVLCSLQPTLLRLLPWRQTATTDVTSGFPRMTAYYYSSTVHLLDTLLMDLIHISFAVRISDLTSLPKEGQLVYFLSTSLTFFIGLISFVEVMLIRYVAKKESIVAEVDRSRQWSAETGVSLKEVVTNPVTDRISRQLSLNSDFGDAAAPVTIAD